MARGWIWLVKKLRFLSVGQRERLARLVGWVLWWCIPKRRHVTLTNLRVCFPELSDAERERLARRVYVRLGRAALDHSVLWEASAEEIRSFVRIEGVEHILNEENRPLIVVAPHFAGLDAAGIALNTYVRGVSLYQKQSNPAWDKATLEGRLLASPTPSSFRKARRAICVP